jgi:hypothetical protein
VEAQQRPRFEVSAGDQSAVDPCAMCFLEICEMAEDVLKIIGFVVVGVLALYMLFSRDVIMRGIKLLILAGASYAGLIAIVATSSGWMLWLGIAGLFFLTIIVAVQVFRFIMGLKSIVAAPQIFQAQTQIRVQKSAILADLSRMRDRLLAARAEMTAPGDGAYEGRWKQMMDELDQVKMEIEGTSIGDDSALTSVQYKDGVEGLLRVDQEIQEGVAKMVENFMSKLGGVPGAEIGRHMEGIAGETMPRMGSVRERIRQRQTLAKGLI